MYDLKGKNIIVTGASGGIGYAICSLIIELGGKVLAVDISKDGLNKIQQKLGNNIEIFNGDITDKKIVNDFFEKIKDKHIYGLINNAGVYLSKNILDYNEDDIDFVLGVNLKSLFFMTQQFGKKNIGLKEKSVIVNISSIAGQEGGSDAVYGTTKAGIDGFTKSIARNFSPNIRCNSIAPGVVSTPMMASISKERLEEYKNNSLLQKIATPEDVAQSCIFLLSNMSKSYTGTTFDLNNGCHLR